MKIFGDDGFRSSFGKEFMSLEFILAFANSISHYYFKKTCRGPILIGRDTRRSGVVIENAIASVLNFTGIDTAIVGTIPTPGLSSTLQNNDYPLGIMITASHDPATYNGIKLFGHTGMKLDEEAERGIGDDIKLFFVSPKFKFRDKIGDSREVKEHREEYASRVKTVFVEKSHIPDTILVDCGNGAYSEIAKLALQEHTTIQFISDKPDGNNINLNCGALEPEKLLNLVERRGFGYGVGFDGDGDRAIFVSRKYGIIETEKLTVLFAKMLREGGSGGKIISTEICNKGLEKNCGTHGFRLIQTKVGDRNVVNSTTQHGGIVGAEPSGHYFFPKNTKTMDGLLALFHFIELLQTYGDHFVDELKGLAHYNRVKKDLPTSDNSDAVIDYLYQKINPMIDNEKEKLIIRNSMWDPIIRIYYDYEHKNNFEQIDQLITKSLPHIS